MKTKSTFLFGREYLFEDLLWLATKDASSILINLPARVAWLREVLNHVLLFLFPSYVTKIDVASNQAASDIIAR